MKQTFKVSVIALAICLVIASAVVIRYLSISHVGIITTPDLRSDIYSIDWGIVNRGENYTRSFTLSNVGNVNLTLSASNNAPSFISTGWNRENYTLVSQQSVVATVWLVVSLETQETTFAFNYTVSGV